MQATSRRACAARAGEKTLPPRPRGRRAALAVRAHTAAAAEQPRIPASPGEEHARQALEAQAAAAARAAALANSNYAILRLGGVSQMVEEGRDYTCLARFVQEARHHAAGDHVHHGRGASGNGNGSSGSGAGSVVVFDSVLGLRSDGRFTWGRPFVPHAAVVAEVLEHFPGPVPRRSSSGGGAALAAEETTMARFRVLSIAAAAAAGGGDAAAAADH